MSGDKNKKSDDGQGHLICFVYMTRKKKKNTRCFQKFMNFKSLGWKESKDLTIIFALNGKLFFTEIDCKSSCKARMYREGVSGQHC